MVLANLLPRLKSLRPSPGLLALVVCLISLAGAGLVSTYVFDRVPHAEDEVAFLFQARTMASGHLLAGAPKLPEFFFMPFIILRDGHWFGKYPPGFPAALALGELFGQPWLINPLFGALSVGLVYLAGRRFYGAPTGLMAAALAIISPFFLLQAGSFLSHVVTLFWTLAFVLFFDTARRERSRTAAAVAGAALGMVLLSRPLTAVGMAAPFVFWAAFDILRVRRRLLDYLPLVAAFLPFLAGLLLYNRLTTGDPLRSAYELWWPYDRVGFGTGIGIRGNHTLEDGLFETNLNIEALADYLYGWPSRLSLVPAFLAAGLGVVRLVRRGILRVAGAAGHATTSADAWDMLQVGLIVSLVGVHVAYWAAGQMYGPRYYFEAMGALLLLSARGIFQAADIVSVVLRLTARRLRAPRAWATGLALSVTAGLAIYSLTSFAPQEFGRFKGWYSVDSSGLRVVEAAKPRNAVVFVEQEYWTGYAPFFSQNAPSLDGEVVYVIDLGPNRNADLMALYPGRAFFRYAQGQLEGMEQP